MQDQFAALHADAEERARNLAHRYAEGALTAIDFGHAMADLLTDAHTQAVVLGRWHAGDHALEEADDRRFAEAVMEGTAEKPGQLDYLAGFVDDLNGGRYQDEDGTARETGIARRAGSYASALLGTASEVWALALPEETRLWWRVNDAAEHCRDCPSIAERNPWTAASIPTYPGQGMTACLANCRCWVETGGGEIGFRIGAS